MSALDFKPINCRKCGNLVWDGISATSLCQVKLDTNQLNIVEEIEKLSTGIATYEIHRTTKSFEATRRSASRMSAKKPIVLATHTCYSLTIFAEQAPEYFKRPLQSTHDEEVPF